MKDRILARRNAFVAAALVAACDRSCGQRPEPCLSVTVQDAEAPPMPCLSQPPPLPCLQPRVCLEVELPPPDAGATLEGGTTDTGATIEGGTKDAGGVRLNPIDVTVDGGKGAMPKPCLSVVPPRPCLRPVLKKDAP